VEAYTSLARIYNNQKKFDLAAEATRKASEVASKENEPDPAAAAGTPAPSGAAAGTKKPVASGGSSGTLYNQGVVLWNSGKYAEAKAQFEAALKADPNNIDALYQLGMANLNLGQIPAARTSFERYLKVAPNGPKAAELKTYLAQLPK
jgi:TolA-binding protein